MTAYIITNKKRNYIFQLFDEIQEFTSNMKVSTSSLISKSVNPLLRNSAIKISNMAIRFFLT